MGGGSMGHVVGVVLLSLTMFFTLTLLTQVDILSLESSQHHRVL